MGKVSKKEVLDVRYWGSIHNCNVIEYEKEPNFNAYAAVPDNFSVKKGDTVLVFSDDKLSYSGFCAVVVPYTD